MKKTTIYLFVLFLLVTQVNGFAQDYQKVTFNKETDDSVFVNGAPAKFEGNQLLLMKDQKPKQIIIKREGFRDRNVAVMKTKKGKYPDTITLPEPVPVLKNGDGITREIDVKQFTLAIEPHEIKTRYFESIQAFLSKKSKKEALEGESSETRTANPVFLKNTARKFLHDKTYLDTNTVVMQQYFLDRLLIEGKLKACTIHQVNNGTEKSSESLGGFVYSDLTIEWSVLDDNGNVFFEGEFVSTSGQFAYFTEEAPARFDALSTSVEDALQSSLVNLINTPKITESLRDEAFFQKD